MVFCHEKQSLKGFVFLISIFALIRFHYLNLNESEPEHSDVLSVKKVEMEAVVFFDLQ